MACSLNVGALAKDLGPVKLFDENIPVQSLQARVESAAEAPIALHDFLSIHEYRHEPLGHRTPLVLVHGIGGDANHYHWGHFLDYAESRPDFEKRFKIYLVHYDSEYSVAELSDALSDTLRVFVQNHHSRPIKVVAYSEGGLLTRNAMQDPELNRYTGQVITIATPFHGSPLANPDWIEKQVLTEPLFSPLRMTYKVAYWVTRKQHPSFETDFHWDNFDQAIGREDYEKSYGQRGEVTQYALGEKTNFITYGSFFGEEVDNDDTQLTQTLELQQPLSEERTKLPQLLRRNVFFTIVQKTMAHLPHALKKQELAEHAPEPDYAAPSVPLLAASSPTAVMAQVMVHEPAGRAGAEPTVLAEMESVEKAYAAPLIPAKPDPAMTSNPAMSQMTPMIPLMAYNDGISPISSTLWLGRYTPNFKSVKNPVDQAWAALKSLKGQQVARLFHGLDHRNWMDGDTRVDGDEVKDLLNPNEPSRTVFEWLLHDLMAT